MVYGEQVKRATLVQPECEHPEQERRRFTASNGSTHCRLQCLTCGAQVGTVQKQQLDRPIRALVAWDETLRLTYWKQRQDERQAFYEQQREQEQAEWWTWYEEYLQSAEWRQKRSLVLERDSRRCQAAIGSGCQQWASQVHHLSYAHVGNEPLFELVAVCVSCHTLLTEMDRNRRGDAGQ